MTRIRVFLVDDHSIVLQGLRALLDLEADMEVAGESAHGRGLSEDVRTAQADVVVMDVSMPDAGGAQATVEIKRALPRVKVIALTRHTERAYVQQMLQAGASGYILKQNGAEVLLAAIRAVIRGGTYLDPIIAAKAIGHLTAAPDRPRVPALTPREQQIAIMIAYGHSNKEIASALGITVKTVETHKSNIMASLELTSRAQLVQFALDQGWLERSPRS